jgi:hypothetical protein
MGRELLRKVVSCTLLFLIPSSAWAADSNAAMLYTNGAAWLNGGLVPRSSSAIFSGDLVQTRPDAVANIHASGSAITILADSLVKFKGGSLDIDHGGVAISTSKQMAAEAGDVKISPASASWTEFNVIDTDGTVRIAARKGDLSISDGDETMTLAEGQETTRSDSSDQSNQSDQSDQGKKKHKRHGTGAVPAAGGSLLDSPVAIGIGAGAIAGFTTWILVKGDDPVSPHKP